MEEQMSITKILPLVALAASGALAQTQLESVRGMNAEVLQLHSLAQGTEASQRPALSSEKRAVFGQRSAELSALIEQNPKQALRMAFPPDLVEELATLFPDEQANLESHGEWQGPVEDFIVGTRSIVRMKAGGEEVMLHFAAGKKPDFQGGDVLSVRGIRAGDRIAVDKVKVIAAPVNGDQLSPRGDQRIAVILVNFANTNLPVGVDADRIRAILLGNSDSAGSSVDDFWQQNSGGKTSVKRTGEGALTVVGPYSLGQNFGCADSRELLSAATSAADKDLNYGRFSRLLIVRPSDAACAEGGSTKGASAWCSADEACGHSWGWVGADSLLKQESGVASVAHSLGHQLGLDHASAGDDLGFGLYNAHNAIEKLGWFEKDKQYVDVSSTGAYSVEASTKQSAGLKALKIQRGDRALNASESVVVELREGQSARLSGDADLALAAGKTWKDPYSDLSVKVDSAVNDVMNVNVSYGSKGCSQIAPGVEVSPFNVRARVGEPATYTVTVTNQDSPNCTATFALSSPRPGEGWSATVEPSTLTLEAGASGTAKLIVQPSTGAAGATHDVKVDVTRAGADAVTTETAGSTVTEIAPPGPATNPTPANGATGLGLDVTMKWTKGAGATWHKVYFGTTNPPPFATGRPNPDFRPALLNPGTKYYWRVEEQNSAGINSSSPMWSFTTKPLEAPGVVKTMQPRDKDIVHTNTGHLRWKADPNKGRPVSYDVYLGTTPNPPFVANVPQVKQDLQWFVNYSFTLDWATTYYWRVVAKNAAGSTSSAVFTFTIKSAPGSPKAGFPGRGQVGVPRNTHLSWSAAKGSISHYKLYFGTSNPPPFLTNVNGTMYNFPSLLQPKTKYFWRVIAVTTQGTELPSEISYFTTK
jgi:hypothetical protein